MNDQSEKVRVVGIGASAGAMEPLKDFFEQMDGASGLAFVVIQHLDPDHVSYMADIVGRHTSMNVAQAREGTRVEANCVYTIPPNNFLFIEDGVLHLTAPIKRAGLKLPIDFFFRSLAQDQGADAVAVLFSGGGSDGTLGIREIRGAGGLVIVQQPETAQFDSMIESAIATGLVDLVLPVREIPGKLLHHARRSAANEEPQLQNADDKISAILDLLANHIKSDFRSYRMTTIRRRIERRMSLSRISDISEYYRLLVDNPAESANLAKDMLIGVTSFFRDPEAFAMLRDRGIGPLVQANNGSAPIRAWIAGAATGEEAYSIAMLFMEEMAQTKKNLSLQIFASDIDREALKYAREGIYPPSIAADVSEERLARFFVKKENVYQIDSTIRECVTFAEHNVMTDPPFLRMDLISCRNLLIYIQPEVQRKVLNLFGFALKPAGYLFLGKSDTTIDQSDMFEPISKSSRIFRRRDSVAVPIHTLPAKTAHRRSKAEEQRPVRLADLNQQVLLQHFHAVVVLIAENGDIAHFYGDTHKYLAHPYGEANLNLYKMVDRRSGLALRLAIERAARDGQPVKLQLRELNRQDATELVDASINPVVEANSPNRLLAVIFQSTGSELTNDPEAGKPQSHGGDRVAQLEAENKRLKQDLESAIESLQITHEEFTAANEEVLAINEELQSTNEELETSKEELQSINEELITVNNQLNDKVEELSKANDDLANFLNSSEVATLFLDRRYCIRRFTPSTTKILSLISHDVGRPIGHISNKLVGVDLTAVAEGVLKNLGPYEREVASADACWYMMRCVPYRTLANMIDGVVFTFTDVTRLKHSEEAMRQARDYADNIIKTIPLSLVVLDAGLRVIGANRAFYQAFRVLPEDTQQRLIYELGGGAWNIPRLRELLEGVLERDSYVENFEVEHDFPGIGRKIMSLNARKMSSGNGTGALPILLVIEDITARKQAEAERHWIEGELRQAQKMESVGTLAAGIAHDFNNSLNIIQGYAVILRDLGASNDLIAESVAAILDASQRAATIVQQLLTLARKTEPKLELINMDSLIDELAGLLRQTLPKTIELDLDVGRCLPPILADRNQMTQALLNLCINARDAMPEGGNLMLQTAVVNREDLPNRDELTEEKYVRVDIRDTGMGIDENVMGRIFEPFFTTKGAGRGTGLGLAVVYGVVKHHKGCILVTSKPMEGSCFRVYLPVHRVEQG